MKSKSADITCDQTLVETDKVMKVSEFLGKSRIKKYFYVLSKISDEKKLKIIFSLIAQESLCVCDIAYILGCSIATASHHLRMLYDADILDTIIKTPACAAEQLHQRLSKPCP